MNRSTIKAIPSTLLLAALAGAASAQCDSVWVKANDGTSGDIFGSAVAMSQEWLAVGARGEDDAGNNSGALYIYARFGPAFIQVHKGVPTTANSDDQAGWSVDVDSNHAIVGHLDASLYLGGATIYKINTNTWFQQATLTPPGLTSGDRFGIGVAVDGVTAIVGAPGDDDTGLDSGAVYFFTEQNGTWSSTGKMTLFNNVGSEIGASVAIDGLTAAVGAPARPVGNVQGAGTVFTVRQGLGWNLSQTLTNPNPQANEGFGNAVDIQGDVLVVGAPFSDDPGNPDVGAIYIYERSNQQFSFVQRFSAPDDDFTNNFGRSVAVYGDIIAVGAEDGATPKVYYFRRDAGGEWNFEAVYNGGANPGGYANDVAVYGQTIAIGADTRTVAGAAANTTGGVQAITLNPDTGANSFFDAVPIAVPSTHTGCTSGATNDWDTTCGTSNDSPDVWYQFVAPVSGKVSVDTIGSSYDTVLSAHTVSQVIIFNGETIVCNDDIATGNTASRITFNVIQGATYRVRVSGFSGAAGEYTLNIRMQCPADLTSGAIAGSPGYGIPNGVLNNDDFFYYLAQFAAGNLAVADMTAGAIPGQPGYGTPDGNLNNDDFFFYLATFAQGC